MRAVRPRPPVQQVVPRDVAVLQRGRPRGAGQLLLRLHLPVRPQRRPGQRAEGAVGGAEGGGEHSERQELIELHRQSLLFSCRFRDSNPDWSTYVAESQLVRARGEESVRPCCCISASPEDPADISGETGLAGAGRGRFDCEEQNKEEEKPHGGVCSSKHVRDLWKKAAKK